MHSDPDSRSFSAGRRRFGQLAAGGMLAAALPSARARSASTDGAKDTRATPAVSGGAPAASGEAPAALGEGQPALRYSAAAPVGVTLAGVPRGSADDATEAAVRRAALAATDFSWLSRGDTVLIKPVSNSGNDYPATTDPVALRAMIALLREQGAGRVIVGEMSGVQFVRFTQDHLRGSTRELMTRNGLARAAEDAGAELVAFEEQGWDAFFEDPVSACGSSSARGSLKARGSGKGGGSWKGGVMMPKILEEVDHVVLMPRCARHLLAGSTLGLKAAVGWWRHDSRLEYHHRASTFSEKTADANTSRTLLAKQRLVLTGATKVLTTFGPDNGWVEEPETGLVMASPSVVAHDMVSLAWLVENRRATPERKRDSMFDDPNRSQLAVNFANRVVCNFLGGFSRFFDAERLERYDVDGIWSDRVLLRAFESFGGEDTQAGRFAAGGVPRVELVDADDAVSRALRERLAREVALPA